jgi:hypothetical protein
MCMYMYSYRYIYPYIRMIKLRIRIAEVSLRSLLLKRGIGMCIKTLTNWTPRAHVQKLHEPIVRA